MKRRSAECGKLRRPLKRSKIGEGIYGSMLTYIKFFLVWTLVLMADFILDFRFEYLWPLWLAIRSVYDSFKYQGMAFSIFFVCVTLTSDVACYLFIPVQWLFFTASTYVWVQYVWQTERGICLPTVLLWLIFLYIEVAIRLRDLKNFPFQLDLCRPFAAHCVGYPVITMGFSFKSCVSYRFRLRKQKEVEKANQFYFELLEKALPSDVVQNNKQKALPATASDDVVVNGSLTGSSSTDLVSLPLNLSSKTTNGWSSTGAVNSFDSLIGDADYLERPLNEIEDDETDDELVTAATSSGDPCRPNGTAKVSATGSGAGRGPSTKDSGNKRGGKAGASVANVGKDVVSSSRVEMDLKRLKADLQSSRCTEQELRSQINSLSICERSAKMELVQLRQENENLQAKLQRGSASRQQDKQNLAILERRLQEERKQRTALEQQLSVATAAEKQRRKAVDDSAALAAASAARNASRSAECTTEQCKSRRWDLDNEVKQLRRELQMREDRLRQLEHETQTLQMKRGESQSETEVLMSALGVIQDKNTQLETSLSAETRLKLDLFSALGDAKRQIEIHQSALYQKEVELSELKSKVAEMMSFLPAVTLTGFSPMRYSPSYVGVSQPGVMCDSSSDPASSGNVAVSILNPEASNYLPKITQ